MSHKKNRIFLCYFVAHCDFYPIFNPPKPKPKVQNYYFHILFRKEYYLTSSKLHKRGIDFCWFCQFYFILFIFFLINRSSIKSEPQKSIFFDFRKFRSCFIDQAMIEKLFVFLRVFFINYTKIDVHFRKNRYSFSQK